MRRAYVECSHVTLSVSNHNCSKGSSAWNDALSHQLLLYMGSHSLLHCTSADAYCNFIPPHLEPQGIDGSKHMCLTFTFKMLLRLCPGVETPGLKSVSSSAIALLEHGATMLRSLLLDCMMLSCSACCYQVLLFELVSASVPSAQPPHRIVIALFGLFQAMRRSSG
jgi:hypothetical protein